MLSQPKFHTVTDIFFGLALTAAMTGGAWSQTQPDDGDPLPPDVTNGQVEESGTTPSAAEMFDTDRNVVLKDTDGDGFPDLTEALEQTNPLDAQDYPGSGIPTGDEYDSEATAEGIADPGFPAGNCRSGYRQVSSRLCISINVHNAASYANAMVYCRDRLGRVASYGDLRYLYIRSSWDAAYNPNGRWIGNFVDDDVALCGNRSITTNNDPDIGNFEGECSRFNSRGYWCAHDRQ